MTRPFGLMLVLLLAVAAPSPAQGHDGPWPLAAVPDGALVHPQIVVVGFTGGLEGANSKVSGVVRIRRSIQERLAKAPDVMALTYSNFAWRRASEDVRELVREQRGAALEIDMGPDTPALPQPLVIVYGHSWGGGAIAKFARELRRDDVDIALAIYIDAFTLRNPRLPDNIRYAINFYQRTGIFKGLPLRGKRKLIPESPESTVVLGSFRLTPDTERFGWSWNLLQPLLYRQHHRLGHDVRLQEYLVDSIEAMRELALGTSQPAPPASLAADAQ
jgi:hypothetical protein